jgi:hypothetical protein
MAGGVAVVVVVVVVVVVPLDWVTMKAGSGQSMS